MADTKRTRRSSKDKWEADIKDLEAKVAKAEEHLKSLKKELEELKNNPPKRKSRSKTTESMIKSLSSNPLLLGKIFAEAGDDKDKLNKLLTEALNSQDTKED